MPTTPPSTKALRIRDGMARRRTPFAQRCGTVRTKACKDVTPPKLIGESWDLGYKAKVYQCPVCHQVMTEYEALG